jgi:hypothetical protein
VQRFLGYKLGKNTAQKPIFGLSYCKIGAGYLFFGVWGEMLYVFDKIKSYYGLPSLLIALTDTSTPQVAAGAAAAVPRSTGKGRYQSRLCARKHRSK